MDYYITDSKNEMIGVILGADENDLRGRMENALMGHYDADVDICASLKDLNCTHGMTEELDIIVDGNGNDTITVGETWRY